MNESSGGNCSLIRFAKLRESTMFQSLKKKLAIKLGGLSVEVSGDVSEMLTSGDFQYSVEMEN